MIEAWPFDPFVIPSPQVLRVGAYPLHGAPVFHVDPDHYHAELMLKRALLAADHSYYVQAYPHTQRVYRHSGNCWDGDWLSYTVPTLIGSCCDSVGQNWSGKIG